MQYLSVSPLDVNLYIRRQNNGLPPKNKYKQPIAIADNIRITLIIYKKGVFMVKFSDLLDKKYIIHCPTYIFMNIYTVSIWALSQILTNRHNINLNTLKIWEKIHWLYQIGLDLLTKFRQFIEGTPFPCLDGFCDALLIDGFMSWTQH